jgi:hypothetical protein
MTLTRHRWLSISNPIPPEAICAPEPYQIDYLFKVADSSEELLEAYHLLYHEYIQAGYVGENRNQLLFTKHHLLPKTTVLVAKSEITTLSTATLVRDSGHFGLPMDELYSKELSTLRKQKRKIMEVCSLASSRMNFSRIGIQNFTRLLFLYCVFLDIDDVCVMVNPKHVSLYQRLCELEIFGEEKYYPRVNAPAVALRADVRTVREKLRHKGLASSYPEKLISHYLALNIGLCSEIVDTFKKGPTLRSHNNPLDAHLLNLMLSNMCDSLKDLSEECKNLLNTAYSDLLF